MVKNPPANAGDLRDVGSIPGLGRSPGEGNGNPLQYSHLQCRRPAFSPWVGKIPWRRKWQSTPVFLPEKSHGQRSLAGYSLWGHKESGTVD